MSDTGEMAPVSPMEVDTVSDYRLSGASGNPRPKQLWLEHTGIVVQVLGAQVELTRGSRGQVGVQAAGKRRIDYGSRMQPRYDGYISSVFPCISSSGIYGGELRRIEG